MKNRERVGVLPAIAFALPYFAGCQSFESLTNEEQAMIGQSIEYANAEAALVEHNATAADPNTIFDSSGTSGATAFSEDLETTLATLNSYYEQNKIVGYRGDDIDNDGVPDSASYRGDVIAVSLKRLHNGGIDAYELIHEAGHELYPDHDPPVTHRTWKATPLYAQDVIDAHDYPYLLTLLFYPADEALDKPYDAVARQIENIEGRIENEGLAPQDAYNELANAYFCQPEEVWAERATESAFLNNSYLSSAFAISDYPEFYTSYLEGDVPEYLKEDVYRPVLTSFAEKYKIPTTYTCPTE